MKKHLLTLCLLIISNFLHAQDIAFIPSTYIGGYNVSCNGATDGTLQAILNGDGAPYTYQWSNGSYSSSITNIGAGVYTLTVTNTYGAQITNSFEMLQPNPLSALAYVSDYNGSNVSENGGRDGEITIEATGGGAAGNSTYLWSNGANERRITELQAGTYTVTLTDPNQCTYTLSRTLIEPQLLQITGVTKSNYNGFNTSCYGFENGWAEVSAIGGTTPYTYRWSNGSFRQRAEDLNAGNYAVEVIDANNIKAVATITITQPDKLEPNLNVTTYPNGYNISCFNCSNGAASLAITGGVSPFSIAWSIGANANSISGLNAGNYNLMITDANGCIDSKDFNVTQPDREDWSMNGNTNSNPATQYMGTADSTDFKIKTKGIERMKFGSDGEIYIDSTSKLLQNGPGALYIDANGKLKTSAVDVLAAPCAGLATPPAKWNSSNTDLNLFTCPQTAVGIGDWSIPSGIGFYVNVPSRFDFPIGIGTSPQTGYKLVVNGNVGVRELRVKAAGLWPDYVFAKEYKLKSLSELKTFISDNGHLPNMPSANEVEKDGQSVGTIQLLQQEKIEELFLYVLQLSDQLEQTIQTNKLLEERLKNLESKK
jgi:hypothetical protein